MATKSMLYFKYSKQCHFIGYYKYTSCWYTNEYHSL